LYSLYIKAVSVNFAAFQTVFWLLWKAGKKALPLKRSTKYAKMQIFLQIILFLATKMVSSATLF